MIAWVMCAYVFISFFALIFCVLYEVVNQQNEEIKEQISVGNRVLCMYRVLDVNAGDSLVCGVKYRSLKDLYYNGEFKSGIYKVQEYTRCVSIKGRNCIITYWASPLEKRMEVGRLLDKAGRAAGFR